MPIEKGEIERREGTEESFEERKVVEEKEKPVETEKEEKSFFTAIIKFFKRLWGR